MTGTGYGYTYLFEGVSIGGQILSSIITLTIGILSIIALWKIFVKAGEKGWKALIPFYNVYILFKICWETRYFWTYLILAFVIGILSVAVEAVPEDSAWALIFTIALLVALGFLVYYAIMLDVNLSKAFGHGGGFAVGLIFLSFIFELILAFGDSKYVGNKSQKNIPENNNEQNK